MKKYINLNHLKSLSEVESYQKEYNKIFSLSKNYNIIKKIAVISSIFSFIMIINNLDKILLSLLFFFNIITVIFINNKFNKNKNRVEENLKREISNILIALEYNYNLKEQKWHNKRNPNYKFSVVDYDYSEIELSIEENIISDFKFDKEAS